jgi:hypothetical protein
VRRREDGAQNGEESRGAGLLYAGLEEIGGLEEHGGAKAREQAREEMEGRVWFGLGLHILW